jgi:FkbM family methyltransferase
MRPLDIVFKILSLAERKAAYYQGKGYGTATIKKEVKLTYSLLEVTPSLAIDIGGNIGEYTAELHHKNPHCEIHTFEPSITNIEKLNNRFSTNKLIKILPFAVSNISGAATLFSNQPGSGLGSLTKRKLEHFNIDFNVKESISTIRFEDYWLNQLNRRTIDIVKIDIEGHELDALSGFGQALNFTRVIQFEFGGCNIDTRTYFQDFWYFFKDNNFDIFRITPLGLEKMVRYKESDEFFSTTNFIAVNLKLS